MIRKTRRFIQALARQPGARWALIALCVYSLFTAIALYPVPLQMNSVIAGEFQDGDAYQYTWSLWWAKQAIFNSGKGLAHLTLMNHPVGVKHPFMLTLVVVNLMALPFSLISSPAFTYNAQVLLSFIMGGLSMYWLAMELTGNRKAAIVGGFIFAFFPNKTGHVLGGHLPQITVCWLPLYALFLWRLIHKPRWRTALFTALVLVPASLTHVIHLAYFVLPVTVFILLAALVKMKRAFFTRRRLGALALSIGLAALVVFPVLLPTVRHSLQDDSYLQKEGTINTSTDLLAFLSPSPYHPGLDALDLIPSYARRTFRSPGDLREGAAYLGVVTLGLALWALIRHRRKAWIWGLLALTAAGLSLGPFLKVGGDLVSLQIDEYRSLVTLPYALLKQMPVLDVGRTPGRLNETTMFAVAILASYGAADLFSLLDRRFRLSGWLLALLLPIIGFEYIVVWPFPTATAQIPPVIRRIADESPDGALLYLDIKWREVNHPALYHQTVTHRPIVGGKAHRVLPQTLPWWETLEGLAQGSSEAGDIAPRPVGEERLAWLRHFDVAYVIARKSISNVDAISRDFTQAAPGLFWYEDGTWSAFPIPENLAPTTDRLLYTFSRSGWDFPRQDGGLWRRWMSGEGRLYIYAASADSGSLRFNVDTRLEFPTLELYKGEDLLDAFVVQERTTYTTRPFTLTQGMNVFHFHALEKGPRIVETPHCWREKLLAPPSTEAPLFCDPQAIPTTRRDLIFDSLAFVPSDQLRAGEAVDIALGDQMRLRGWEFSEASLRPGALLTVTTFWEATARLSEQYVIFVHLIAPDGTLIAQRDAPPIGETVPASAWSPGATIRYPAKIKIPEHLPPGDYHVQVGVYTWPSLERLSVPGDVPGAENDAVILGNMHPED